MKKLFLLAILLCLTTFGGFAQKRPTPDKSVKPKPKSGKISPPIQTKAVDKTSKAKQIQTSSKTDKPKKISTSTQAVISEGEWKNVTDALKAEDWGKSSALSTKLLNQIKTDDEKKRLAQLRYFHLFALAGRIFQFVSAGEQLKEAEAWKDLDAAIKNFTGQEFVLPPRRFLGDCSQALNFICQVKDNEKALRVTATNSEGTLIHSFEYVLFREKIDLKEFANKEIFLGGNLKRVDFNNDLTKTWAMRLFFENGFIRVIVAE
jgi:hypothetical protein